VGVYVDEPRWFAHGRYWCHMVADTPEELDEIARKLQLKPRWKQKVGTPSEHYDLPVEGREAAVALGAIPVSSRQIVTMIRARRASSGS
jgi:hypothetical protein